MITYSVVRAWAALALTYRRSIKNDINESIDLRRNYLLSSHHGPDSLEKKSNNNKNKNNEYKCIVNSSFSAYRWCCDKLSSRTQELLMLKWKLLTTTTVWQVKERPYLTTHLDDIQYFQKNNNEQRQKAIRFWQILIR